MRFLPQPTGKYTVGFTDVIDKYGINRTMFRLFYPTKQIVQNYTYFEESPYLQGLANFTGNSYLYYLMNLMFYGLSFKGAKNSPPIEKEKFPIAVFSHGLGGNRFIYTTFCTELASRGMVVAAVEHCDKSASATYYLEEDGSKTWVDYLHVKGKPEEYEVRNKQVKQRADDCSKALEILHQINDGNFSPVESGVNLNEFTGKLDVKSSAMIGHSMGGATVAATLSRDNKFKVGVAMDLWGYPLDDEIYKNLTKSVPMLLINTFHFNWPANLAQQRRLDEDTTVDHVERNMVTIRDTVHQSQADSPYFLPNQYLSKKLWFRGELDPIKATKLNSELAISFVGKHLNTEFAREISDIVNENTELFFGSNIEINEAKVRISKERIRKHGL